MTTVHVVDVGSGQFWPNLNSWVKFDPKGENKKDLLSQDWPNLQ
jgi:hypothetical protein